MEEYIKEEERQLHNTENCKRLNHNPTTTNNDTVNQMIKRFHKENLISKNITEGLKIESPKSPHFHLKIKLHKEGVTGRPVISSVNCHTSKISEYVDYHLQPIVREIRSYVKDTSEFLRKISAVEFVPDNYLVSLDVKSIYTNIPSAEVIKAVKESLENYPKRTVATKVITTFLALILTLDNLYLTLGTICKQKSVLWEPSVHHHTPIYLWIILKKNLYTHLPKGSYLSISDLLTTYFLYGLRIRKI